MTFLGDLTSDNGLRALFCVLMVATLLTIYELAMFFFIVAPAIEVQIDKGLEKVSQNMKGRFDELARKIRQKVLEEQFKSQDPVWNAQLNTLLNTTQPELPGADEVDRVFSVFNDRERLLTSKINGYTKITGLILLFVLSVGLIWIWQILKSRGQTIGLSAWLIILYTMTMILIFQYVFYGLGKKYKYMGAYGNEELVLYLLNNI